MPKNKTHKGLAKRVKVTGRKKALRRKSYVGHLLSGRSARRRRRLHKSVSLPPALTKKVLERLGE
ncbi:MAG TPA: 50S ribosomal protein L35 [Phycisphaerae bacterium]|nr:50S ribosomal protein L35 [Phycisphaerae bacterium]